MNLMDLMIKVGVDDQASGKISGIAGKVTSGLGRAAKTGALAMTATVAAVGAVTTAFANSVNAVADYGDNIDKMSQKMGMSAEAYQEWDAVMQHSGTSMETMKASMKTLANAAETGSDAFDRLGISQEQIASMSQEELFSATISALQNVESETERTYLAGKLLGRGATELGALLNTSAEDTQAMKDRLHQLGGVMSDEAVKNSAKFKDSLQDLQAAMGGVKNQALAEFLPALTLVSDGLQEVFAGDSDLGIEKITEGVQTALESLNESLPQAIEFGGQLIGSLLQGILETMPNLITGLADGITQLIDSVTANTDGMMNAAGELFMSIATALAQAVPRIAASLWELLISLVGYVVSHAPEMLAAAAEFIGTFATSVAAAAGDVLSAIGELIQGGIDEVGNWVSNMFAAGGQLIQGFIDGILGGISGVINAIGSVVGAGIDEGEGMLQISSPSKVFRRMGQYTVEGYIEGVNDLKDRAVREVSSVFGAVTGSVGLGYQFGYGLQAPALAAAGVGSVVNNYYIDGVQYMPDSRIAEGIRLFVDEIDLEGRA